MKLFMRALVFVLLISLLAMSAACGGKENAETTPGPGETTSAAKETTAPTAAPTTAPAETEPEEPVVTIVDFMTTYYSVGKDNGWANYIYSLGEGNDGKQYAGFLVTPAKDNIDGIIGFADSGKQAAAFDDFAMQIRLSPEGFFEVYNGDKFEKLANVPYTANTGYFIVVLADMRAKTYTVYVEATENERVKIAENSAFAATASDADDLGQVFFVSSGENEEFTVDYLKRQWWYDDTKEYWSKGENFGWQQDGINLGQVYTGKVEIEFDMTFTGDNVGGSVDFTGSKKDLFGFGDLAAMVRINFTYFDARNGAVFEEAGDMPAVPDTLYHIYLEADLDTQTYSYWVTPPGGERTLIADNYGFRETALDVFDFGQCFVVSCHASDQIMMQNLVIRQK
ncbi:MAG: hypothetical protein PHV32_10985 [Eubacteriales bacterium]|nr:hypothetical protein [Eubacteriales bacterium]